MKWVENDGGEKIGRMEGEIWRRELVSLFKNFRKSSHMMAQLIVVSHDRELEEAADVVYEVARENGVSKIKSLTETSSGHQTK